MSKLTSEECWLVQHTRRVEAERELAALKEERDNLASELADTQRVLHLVKMQRNKANDALHMIDVYIGDYEEEAEAEIERIKREG